MEHSSEEEQAPGVQWRNAPTTARLPSARCAVANDTSPDRPARVLFASTAGVEQVGGLQRASELAWATRAELHVLRVVACAPELDVQLVVLPSPNGLKGPAVTSLSRAVGAPVLVTRPPAEGDSIVAATDLEDETYPVLRQAAAFGRRLKVPVVAVHNVTPRSLVTGIDTSWLKTVLPGGAELLGRERRLAAAVERCRTGPDAVVANEGDSCDAILGQARARNADLLVVGTRGRSWFPAPGVAGVATHVVERARRSVLVTPIDTIAASAP